MKNFCSSDDTIKREKKTHYTLGEDTTVIGKELVSGMYKVKSLSCLRLFDLMDCSLPGSSIHEIFQARVLEWDAIAFSKKPDVGQRAPKCIFRNKGCGHGDFILLTCSVGGRSLSDPM